MTASTPAPETPTSKPWSWSGLDASGWLLVVGLLLRLAHYLLNHTIWYDEAGLLYNILGKDYSRLLGPLDYEVAAPPLFLWSLRAMVEWFGDHSYVWRFPPFVFSCLTLVLMTIVARRVLRPAPAALLVGLVAFSDAFVWLGCNVKPYIIDAFFAAGLLLAWLFTEHWPAARRMLLFAAAAPVLLCFSYPVLFLYCGIFLALLPVVWRERNLRVSLAYLGMAAVLLATLACLYFGPIHAQRVPGLVAGWKNKFPPLDQPASVPGWILGNTFLVFHYCYNPIGAAFVLFTGAGVWWCLKRGRLDLVCLCLTPVVAVLLASIAQAYPYSNNRLIFFAAPGIGLLTALGFSLLLESSSSPRRVMACLVVVFLLPEFVLSASRFASPWDYPDSSSTSSFVRTHRLPGDLIASDHMSYTYAFFGEAHSLQEMAAAPCPDGQRVWVLLENATPMIAPTREGRLELARTFFTESEWELRAETLFHSTSALLFVRHQSHKQPLPPNPPPPQGEGGTSGRTPPLRFGEGVGGRGSQDAAVKRDGDSTPGPIAIRRSGTPRPAPVRP